MKSLRFTARQVLILICCLLPIASNAESYHSPKNRFAVEYAAPWTPRNDASAELTLDCDPFVCGPDVFLTFSASFSEKLKDEDSAEFLRSIMNANLGWAIINRLKRSPDVYAVALVKQGDAWSHFPNAKAYEVVADVTLISLQRRLRHVFTTFNAGYTYWVILQCPPESHVKSLWAADPVLNSFRLASKSADPPPALPGNLAGTDGAVDEAVIANVLAPYGDQALSLAQPYMDRLIQYTPDEKEKEILRGLDPRLWVVYGFDTCKQLEQGTRESTIRSSLDSFYGPDTGRAIVQAAKDVVCPRFKGPSAEPLSDLRGRIENDQYVSPDKLYRVRIPHLTQPGAIIEDQQQDDSKYVLTMRDDFGTFYSIVATKSEGRMTVAEAEEGIRSAGQLREQTTVTTPRGEEARFLLLKEKGSHLQSLDLREKTSTTPDLIQATSIFAVENYVFEVTAGKTPLGQSLVPSSDNEHLWKLAKEHLDQFLDGLTISPSGAAR